MSTSDSLISDLYAAANGRVEWGVALGNIAKFLNIWTIQVIGMDRRTGHLMFSVHGGSCSPQAILDYVRHYNTIDPRAKSALALPKDDWLHCHEHFDDDFVAQSPFYQEFLIPHGGRYLSATVLIDNDDVVFLLGMLQHGDRPPVAASELPLMNHFRYHFVEAMRNMVHLRESYAELGMARELLSQFSYPMLLVDETRGIWHRNDAAVQLLENGLFVQERGGMLACRDRDSDAALTEAIYSLDLSAGRATTASSRRAVPLRGVNGLHCIALVSAIKPEQTMGVFGHSARALIIFHDPKENRSELDPFIVAECFDLTPAEARIAVQLANGASAKEIALRSGGSLATVRTQIQRVMEKTGVDRQADLIRMLLALPVRA